MLLLDVRMPGTSGMVLLERLRVQHPALPVVVITGYGDIDTAVQAMKLGALDFITKPFASQRLLDLAQQVLSRGGKRPGLAQCTREAVLRLATLTTREREVFDRIVRGKQNKAIALDLGISGRTVESHRASLMQKLNVKTPFEFVRIAISLNGTPVRLSPS
jgi:two-component system response regulator FixJ